VSVNNWALTLAERDRVGISRAQKRHGRSSAPRRQPSAEDSAAGASAGAPVASPNFDDEYVEVRQAATDRHDPAATATELDDAGAAVGAVVAAGTVIVGASASVGRGVANGGSDRTDGLAHDTGVESTADRSSPSPQPATNTVSVTVTNRKHCTAERGGINPPTTSKVRHRQPEPIDDTTPRRPRATPRAVRIARRITRAAAPEIAGSWSPLELPTISSSDGRR
jgi:hypothetical protein